MTHTENALEDMKEYDSDMAKFIEVDTHTEVADAPAVVTFAIQSDPISEVGVNGCQAKDMLEYVYYLFKSLNNAFACKENAETLQHIALALQFQDDRDEDRIKRGVEGYNKK